MDWSYSINGNDLFDTCGVGISTGVNDFLNLKTKPPLETNFADENGKDVDLKNRKIDSRNMKLSAWCKGDNNVNYWKNYNVFISLLIQDGTFILFNTTIQIGFSVYFDSITNSKFYTNQSGNREVGSTFDLNLIEPLPMSGFRVQPSTGYLIDANGNPILTNSGRYIII